MLHVDKPISGYRPFGRARKELSFSGGGGGAGRR